MQQLTLHIFVIVAAFLVFPPFSTAQVAINADGSNPDASAILDIKSTDKGLLIPRMTTTLRTNISSPAAGLLVFDSTTNSFWYHNGTAWVELIEGIHTQIADADNNTKIQVEESVNDNTIRFDVNSSEIFTFSKNPNGDPIIDVNGTNTFFGTSLGDHNTGDGNTFIGGQAGRINTTGRRNTIVGNQAGYLNTTGEQNTFIGVIAGRDNVSGNRNVYVGDAAGLSATGSGNVAVGIAAGAYSLGNDNVYIGGSAGREGTQKNVVIGRRAGQNMDGTGNIYLGYYAGYDATGDNKLYIENSSSMTPLIYGEFDNDLIAINGKLGIDTNTPEAKLHVNGGSFWASGTDSGELPTTAGQGIRIFNDATNSVAQIFAYDYTNSEVEKMTIQGQGGLLGIGRAPTTNVLEVEGDASKSTAGSWIANSDARLKKNITLLSSEKMLENLLALQGITYEWNDNSTNTTRPEGIQYGFTAQNIMEVFPTLVSEDNLGYLQTAYGTYDAMTVEAIRALNDKIENLENLSQNLSIENEDLKNRLEKIEMLLQINSTAKK